MSAPLTPHLVLGGARSGKSTFAESLVAAFPPPHVYVATAQVLDAEMEARVAAHRARRGSHWRTVECPLDLPQTLSELDREGSPILVDCITLWLSNLLADRGDAGAKDAVERLCRVLEATASPVVLVSNEVGCGIVPANAMARTYRDLAGWANQRLAAACRAVTLVAAGLPWTLKPQKP
ncbi:adenosylcobinamide kinase /adenosylcobinamide-phosphate guanylyltransferase [Desulfacinum hydrothermale DSM 13146]|uniref:Adenosylcobinamide kinase n=1 Tax=Desulfacinum hydrothermale DSM 13146 TaxID=1121390 RepID=A0A1W1XHW3_9BACT|nr:bifunctional adenosylcobinamide kinase/adenosylcobinamide-phosphate guanylyltransferase [Desulfacinum hydrothermale]SMC23583.1 adenosylcobinamide kinase /adenosylcobinamide-phosphate guanylyltransferase [Desulfacinum hydrothermale DSM 13146]